MSEESKETKNKSEVKEETEKVKTDTKSTFNDAKETIRNVNFKEDAKVTSGYVSGIIKKPLETLKKIIADRKNSNLKNALIIIILWLIVILLTSIFGVHWTKLDIGYNFLEMISGLLAPLIGIVVYSYIIYFMQKSSKRNLTINITVVTTSMIPMILVKILSVLKLFSYEFIKIIEPLSIFATVISIVLIYFSTKELMDEEDDNTFIKKFCSIQFIYFVVYFVLTFLRINIPII